MKMINQDGFEVFIGTDNVEQLIIKEDKLDACVKYVLQGKITQIMINPYMGYKNPNITFLTELKDVCTGLVLPDTIYDTKVINTLHKLKYLGFADNGKDTIDLVNFPYLESLSAESTSRLIGLEQCKLLNHLTLTGYKPESKDITALSTLETLTELWLFVTPIHSLVGIEMLHNLHRISLFRATKLTTIANLQFLSNTLEEIEIDVCKRISDYEELGKVKSLKKIILSDSGVIQSLAFVKQLPNLEFISFVGTNVLNGDISYCEGINYVGFDDKRHYSHKMKQLRKPDNI